MASVTIVGSNNQLISLSFDASANFALAQRIAAQINSSVANGTMVTASDVNGPPPALPAGAKGGYFQTTSGLVAMPAGYTTDIVTKAGSAIVFGSGAAGETILSDQHTNLTFDAAAGSGTVVAGGGTNRLLVTGPGNWSLNTGGGNDAILALGSGNDSIAAGAGHNTIQLGSGNDLVVSAGFDSIEGGSGAETVDATGSRGDFVQGNASSLFFVGGMAGATIMGGSGSDTYFGSTMHTTGGQLVVGGTAGNNLLWAGDGAATLVGGGNNDQLFAYGGSNQSLIAGAGNETLSAAFGGGNDTLTAGSGKDQLFGGSGADTFVGGSGQATITGGSGGDTFAFIKGEAGGSDLVQGIFDPSALKIDLQGYGAGAKAAALASQTVANGSVTIGLSDGTKITFQDVTSLHSSNFI